MARSGRRRGTNDTANTNVLPPAFSIRQLSLFPLTEIEDRRRHDPDGYYRPAKDLMGRIAPLSVSADRRKPSKYQYSLKKSYPSLFEPTFQTFKYPRKVLICMRRKARKEVLHAFKKTGRRGQRKPRRNWYSSISCRS